MAKTVATRMAFGKEIIEIAKTNENFVVCNADTKTCGLEVFGKYFPEREFSFGIAEQNLVGGAAGLAACGNKVFLATFAVFASMRACEQVRTFVCYPNLNVTIIGTHAGLQVGGDGATHAAIEDVAIMRSFPNMTIVQPADAVAAKALAHAAVDFKGPLYVRLHRNPVADLYDPETYKFEWGKANTVVDNGSDMTMIVSGILLKKAVDAAEILKAEGINVRVLDMATIKPLDNEAVIKAAKETGAIMTIEDHTIYGGLGSAVSEVVVQNCPVPMEIVGIQDRFGESGDPELLYRDHGMDVDSIVAKAKAAEISGADLIVNSCSTVGEVADIYEKEVNIPVMKVDLPMAKEAVSLGTKIALIATVETTLGPSQRLIEKEGAKVGKIMECTQYLQNPAWDALQAGHPEEHNRILMESIRELDKMGYDAIVMAQVSMRALLPDLKDVKTPLLCSFFTGYGAVADKLNEIAQSK